MDERKKAFITRGAFRPVMARPLYTMSATRETGMPLIRGFIDERRGRRGGSPGLCQ